MLSTWDRRENDLDRGKRSVWRVVLIDEAGQEIEPIEIVRDRRPLFVVRAEFPALGEFATPYIARVPRTAELFGPKARQGRLRMTSPRGGVEVGWQGQWRGGGLRGRSPACRACRPAAPRTRRGGSPRRDRRTTRSAGPAAS